MVPYGADMALDARGASPNGTAPRCDHLDGMDPAPPNSAGALDVDLDVDLIVLGARNHTRPSALFGSNVADAVSRQAKCPVLIAP
jgi:nucleotide-binding universal stress UspA family protein